MKKIKLILLIFILTFTFSSCDKDDENTEEVQEEIIDVEFPNGLIPITYQEYLNTPSAGMPLGASNQNESYFDLTDYDLIPPVGDQGSQNSCVSWAAGYYLKGFHEKYENDYNFDGNDKLMSPSFIYNQIKLGTCSGGSYFHNAFDLLKSDGICTLERMPYNDSNCNIQPNNTQNQNASLHKIESYKMVEYTNIISNVKHYISNYQPVLIALKTYSGFNQKYNINYEYIYDGVPWYILNPSYHAMMLVGYDDEKNAFKAVNSYGPNWANNGYCWISYDLFTDGGDTAQEQLNNGTVQYCYSTVDEINSSNILSEISISNNLDFGSIQINSTSNPQPLTISNTGTADFNITDIIMPNGYLINGSSATVTVGNSVTFNVTFNPTNTQTYNGLITVENTADNANSSNSTIQVTGTGIDNSGNSSISLTGSLNFNNVEIGSSDTKTFTIHNNGNQSFSISNINFPYSAYTSNWNSGTINANGSQDVSVTFQPTNEQSYNGTIEVIHSADSGNGNISVTGVGINNNTQYSDVTVDEIWFDEESNGNWEINTRIKNIGEIATPNGEDIIIKYYVNGNLVDSDDENPLDPNDTGTEYANNYEFPYNGNHSVEVVVEQVSNEIVTSNNSMTVSFNNSGSSGNPTPITPTDSCNDAPTLEINTEYIVNLDLSSGDIGYGAPIEGESFNGANVQGFWLEFNEPSGFVGDIDIKIYDVSNNFDPVIGRKFSCGGIYYTQWNLSTFVANDGSYGASETFAGHSENNGYTHRIRIYHYYGNETPNISFKIKIEEQ